MVAHRIARALVPDEVRWTLGLQREQLRSDGASNFVRWQRMMLDAWLRDRMTRTRRYRVLAESELRAARRSDTVFVFGSGYSLNDLTAEEWNAIARHDTFGFNAFYHQDWVRVDFHLLRGGVYGELRWRRHADEVASRIDRNPLYAETIFLMQDDYLGYFANQLVGYGLLPEHARIFRYKSVRGSGPPTRSFREGIRHVCGTLSDAVNCAYLLGWRRIVLVGVDLYDSRYFWLPPDRTLAHDAASGAIVPAEVNNVRGLRYDEMHSTARSGIVEVLAGWRDVLEQDGVELFTYNPRSLLASELPVFDGKASKTDE